MSYNLCDMDCDKETNKSDIEEHCSDCLCINESTGGQQQELSATKAWRSTSVVEGRDHPNTLSNMKYVLKFFNCNILQSLLHENVLSVKNAE